MDPEIQKLKEENQRLHRELMSGGHGSMTPMGEGVGLRESALEGMGVQRDPDEDYFMMAVLSLKMIHNEKYDDTDYCFYISASTLYQEVLDRGMPFHKWYSFIEYKFMELRD